MGNDNLFKITLTKQGEIFCLLATLDIDSLIELSNHYQDLKEPISRLIDFS